MQKKEKEREPLFIEMFQKATPFYEGRYAQAKSYQELESEYAYWDIELQKRCDSDLRKVKEQLVMLRASMGVYRDYHYFIQGIDAMIQWLTEQIPSLKAFVEDAKKETEKGPLS